MQKGDQLYAHADGIRHIVHYRHVLGSHQNFTAWNLRRLTSQKLLGNSERKFAFAFSKQFKRTTGHSLKEVIRSWCSISDYKLKRVIFCLGALPQRACLFRRIPYPFQSPPNLLQNHRIINRRGHFPFSAIGNRRHGAAQNLA